MSLTNNISIRIISTLTGTSGVAEVSATVNKQISSMLAGADTMYTVNGETPAEPFANVYDLADASLSNPLGVAVELGTVGMIYFKNTSENAMTFGGGADDIAVLENGILVPAGGVVLLLGSYAVGVDADQITVTGTAAGDGYDLVIIGGDAPASEE